MEAEEQERTRLTTAEVGSKGRSLEWGLRIPREGEQVECDKCVFEHGRGDDKGKVRLRRRDDWIKARRKESTTMAGAVKLRCVTRIQSGLVAW